MNCEGGGESSPPFMTAELAEALPRLARGTRGVTNGRGEPRHQRRLAVISSWVVGGLGKLGRQKEVGGELPILTFLGSQPLAHARG